MRLCILQNSILGVLAAPIGSPKGSIFHLPWDFISHFIKPQSIRKAFCMCLSMLCHWTQNIFSWKSPTINLPHFLFLFRPIFESKARRLSGVQTMMNGNSLIIFSKICFTLLNKSLITLVKQMVFLSLAVNSIKVAGLLSVYLLAYWTNYATFTHYFEKCLVNDLVLCEVGRDNFIIFSPENDSL